VKKLLVALLIVVAEAAIAAEPQEVVFTLGGAQLRGFIYKPPGDGPFPAVLYNHGSERRPGEKPALGALFASHGYVFFVPHRRGHGRSPADALIDSLYSQGARSVVALQEAHLADQMAALAYLTQVGYVDPARIAVAGCSYGGIQTVLAVEANARRNLQLRAAVDFAGGAITWQKSAELRQRMLQAIREASIPVFFVQAANDYDVTPSRTLAAELSRLGKPHRISIFPPYGTTPAEGHGAFCFRGGDVWGPEVFAFLKAAMEK
jgi:carboxymethylenebutenolidase